VIDACSDNINVLTDRIGAETLPAGIPAETPLDPNAMPVPMTPPQRVSFAESNTSTGNENADIRSVEIASVLFQPNTQLLACQRAVLTSV